MVGEEAPSPRSARKGWTLNGDTAKWRTILGLTIAAFQAIIVVFMADIRSSVGTIEGRIVQLEVGAAANEVSVSFLESQASQGIRYTMANHRDYEREVAREIKECWAAISALKLDVAKMAAGGK